VGILVSDLGGGGGIELNRDLHCETSLPAFFKTSTVFF
jgi:hypothetical protein